LKIIKYPNRGPKISKDKNKFDKMETILADRFINNNNNLDPIFHIIPDNIDSLITSIEVIKKKLYIDEI
jgi:hypothetical protein